MNRFGEGLIFHSQTTKGWSLHLSNTSAHYLKPLQLLTKWVSVRTAGLLVSHNWNITKEQKEIGWFEHQTESWNRMKWKLSVIIGLFSPDHPQNKLIIVCLNLLTLWVQTPVAPLATTALIHQAATCCPRDQGRAWTRGVGTSGALSANTCLTALILLCWHDMISHHIYVILFLLCFSSPQVQLLRILYCPISLWTHDSERESLKAAISSHSLLRSHIPTLAAFRHVFLLTRDFQTATQKPLTVCGLSNKPQEFNVTCTSQKKKKENKLCCFQALRLVLTHDWL